MKVLRSSIGNSKADLTLDEFPYLIGRKESPLVKLGEDNPSLLEGLSFLSRKHALIYEKNNKVVIRDEGSLNGTGVNGRAVGQNGTVLQHGDNLVFADKLLFTYQNPAEIISGELLKLKPENKVSGIATIELTHFPAVFGRDSSELVSISGKAKKEIEKIPGNIFRITNEDRSFFIEKLGDDINIKINGHLLNRQKEELSGGVKLEIASSITFSVSLLGQSAKMFDVQEPNVMAKIKHDTVEDLSEKTVYMESPTQFIQVVTSKEGENDGLDAAGDEQSISRRNFFPLKPLLYGTAFAIITALIWGGGHLYNKSGLRQAEKLYKNGEFQAALVIVEEKLNASPKHKAASSLLLKTIVKEYMTKCAVSILQDDQAGAQTALDKSKNFDKHSNEIEQFNRLLQVLVDLSRILPNAEVEPVRFHVDLAGKYVSIHQRWKIDEMNNRSILEELIGMDPAFVDFRKEIYGKLSVLRLIVSRKIPDLLALHEKIIQHLKDNQPQKILPLLQEQKKKFAGATGIDAYRNDLTYFLSFHEAVVTYNADAILGYIENQNLQSMLFLQHFKNKMENELPKRERLVAISHAENAWKSGENERAISLLQAITSDKWQEYLNKRLHHMRQVVTKSEELSYLKGTPKYPKALLEFRNLLDSSKDEYYSIMAGNEAKLLRKELQVEYSKLISLFREKWAKYQSAGTISTMQRMKNSISDTFRSQAVLLKKAQQLYSKTHMLQSSFNLSPAVDMAELGRRLKEEVIFQRQMVFDLKAVLSRHVYEEKLKLLPEQSQTQ